MGLLLHTDAERLDRHVRRVLQDAEKVARADGASGVGTGHLLLALADGDDEAAAFLQSVGGTPDALRRAAGDSRTVETVSALGLGLRRRLRRTTEADDTLLYAVVLAGGPRRVDAEHLLASLCQKTPTQAQEVLATFGVTPAAVRSFFGRRATAVAADGAARRTEPA